MKLGATEQNPYRDVNYRTTMRHLLVSSILKIIYSDIFFYLWKCEMTMEDKSMTTGCISWGVLVRQRGMWTSSCKASSETSNMTLFPCTTIEILYLYLLFYLLISLLLFFIVSWFILPLCSLASPLPSSWPQRTAGCRSQQMVLILTSHSTCNYCPAGSWTPKWQRDLHQAKRQV